MGCRAVHFAVTADEATRLLNTPGVDLVDFVEEIEERWDEEWLEETDKAWDAIHRCLTDGKLEFGSSVFHKCILGDRNLNEEPDYIISFLDSADVKQVAQAIKSINKEAMKKKYDAIDTETYQGEPSDEDFEYTWESFAFLQKFFQKAAADNRAMLFAVSQ